MISYQWSGRPDPDGNTYQFFKTTPGTSLELVGLSPTRRSTSCSTRPARSRTRPSARSSTQRARRRSCQDELPLVFIVHPIEPKAFSPKVQGYDPIPDGMMRFKDVWLNVAWWVLGDGCLVAGARLSLPGTDRLKPGAQVCAALIRSSLSRTYAQVAPPGRSSPWSERLADARRVARARVGPLV